MTPTEKTLTRRAGQAGFTVVEVMIALAVFAVVIGAVATTLSTALNITRNNRHRSTAAHLASQEMDVVRSTDFTTLPLGLVQSNVSVDGIDYTVRRESAWVIQGGTTDPCTSPGGSVPAYMRITVGVTWPNMSGTLPVQSQTVVSPPVGAFSSTSGHIGVKVFDRDAAPAAGHVVRITGPVLSSQATTTDGCAFFAYLPPGAYTVALDTPAHVDGQGIPTPSQPASVTVGNTTSIQFDYDREAALDLALTGQFGGTIPAGVPVTLGNTKLLPTGTKSFPGTGSPRSIGGLFPYADGYQVWAGDCVQADPEGQRPGGAGAYYPGASRDPALVVSPGQTTSGTVRMGTAIVTVERQGLPLSGVVVMARHAPDDGCSGGNLLTLGTTGPLGQLQTALPYGDWQYEVTGQTPTGQWPTEILDPEQTSPDLVLVQVQ
ncbi:MAG: type IV pilus modification PilV family protein [Actinomycetota bacterium]